MSLCGEEKEKLLKNGISFDEEDTLYKLFVNTKNCLGCIFLAENTNNCIVWYTNDLGNFDIEEDYCSAISAESALWNESKDKFILVGHSQTKGELIEDDLYRDRLNFVSYGEAVKDFEEAFNMKFGPYESYSEEEMG